MSMTPRQLWVAAHRFVRSLDKSTQGCGNRAKNGLYPSWMPDTQYRRFLHCMNEVRMARYLTPDKLRERERDAERIKEIEERLDWCEQTTIGDVKRDIRSILKDRYCAW